MHNSGWRYTCTILIGAVLFSLFPLSGIAQTDPKRAHRADKVKAGIQKLGPGKDSKAVVTLYDGAEYKGYISSVGDQNFQLTDTAGTLHWISYSDVKSLGGKNFSNGKGLTIGLLAGIGAALTIVVVLLALEHGHG